MGYSEHSVRPSARQRSEREAFDRWLRQSLRGVHDDIIAEPIPEALLSILDAAAPEPAARSEALSRAPERRPDAPSERPGPG